MQRFISLLGTCAIALVAPLLTGALVAASAMTSDNVSTTSTTTSAVASRSSAAGTTTTTAAQTVTAPQTAVSTTSVATTGNGAPSGPHYNLNIIGVPKDKTASMTTGDGHRIFVQLNGGENAVGLNGKLASQLTKTDKIFLQPAPAGQSFQVLDANATDTNGALFQLPADVSATWTVWVRALGKPGGKSNTTTCATTAGLDGVLGTADDEVLCSLRTLSMERTKGKQTFVNVSADLLFITIVVDPTANAALAACLGVTATTQLSLALFNSCLQNYFWNYDNQGLHLLQLRFYPAAAGPIPPG